MATKKHTETMKELLAKEKETANLPRAGDLIKGRIIKISRNAVILELDALGTGIIYGGELRENKTLLKKLKLDQKISALVLDPENEDGYVELSIKEADIEATWAELKTKKQAGQTITVKVREANRGGLVVELAGLTGFLPVSHLSPKNYPRVQDGDKNKILQELNKFINKEMKVKIIGLDKKADKIIVSERVI